jgi:hypothetical protein
MTTQKNNVVGRDQAGRDIINTSLEVQFPRKSYMTGLIERFKHEKENDIQFHAMLEKLQEYCSNIDTEGDEIVGLERKLSAGKFAGFVEFAKRTKEIFSKKLVKYQLYESAQTIYAYILADVFTRYHNHVYPLVQNAASESEIHKAVHENVIEPIQVILEENVLELFADEINGALYYLTGNCHIKWV